MCRLKFAKILKTNLFLQNVLQQSNFKMNFVQKSTQFRHIFTNIVIFLQILFFSLLKSKHMFYYCIFIKTNLVIFKNILNFFIIFQFKFLFVFYFFELKILIEKIPISIFLFFIVIIFKLIHFVRINLFFVVFYFCNQTLGCKQCTSNAFGILQCASCYFCWVYNARFHHINKLIV